MRRREEGFSYLEVMVSMVVLVIVSGMIYQGIQVAMKVQQQSVRKIAAAQYAEGILQHYINAAVQKGTPTAKKTLLLEYLSTEHYDEVWLGKTYEMEQYDYHIASIPYDQKATRLDAIHLSEAKYLTTGTEDVEPYFTQLLQEDKILFKQLSATQPKVMGAFNGQLVMRGGSEVSQPSIFSIRADQVLLNIIYKGTMDQVIYYEVAAGEWDAPELAKAKHLHMPLVIQVDAGALQQVAGSPNKIIFTNTTSFPTIIEVITKEEGSVIEVETFTEVNKGHVTLSRSRKQSTPLQMVILVVTKKGEEPWQVLQKQMVMMGTLS
ncbi:MAG: PulJ/GspJ family protein [Cellulosilyticaceae bacterium]